MDDEHLQSSAGYLNGTVWEKISVDFSTHQTPYVLTMSEYFSTKNLTPTHCCLKTTSKFYLKVVDGLSQKFPGY